MVVVTVVMSVERVAVVTRQSLFICMVDGGIFGFCSGGGVK